MKKISIIATTLLASVLFGACSKSDSGSSTTPVNDYNKVKTAKFTITVTGSLEDYDQSLFIFSSGTAGGGSTVWKVNGETRTNEGAISINEDDFAKKTTYVVELTQPVAAIAASISCINFDAPFSFSYKAEINGKVVKDIVNETVTDKDDYKADYSYTE